MQVEETVTIINKSGKIVSTGKHLVNILKDAKAAYRDKKNELITDNVNRSGNDSQSHNERHSVAHSTSSRHSRCSRRSRRHCDGVDVEPSPLPLTDRNLSHLTDESPVSVPSNRSRPPLTQPDSRDSPDTASRKDDLHKLRRHSAGPNEIHLISTASTRPPPYTPRISRSHSTPNIDMNLAYGRLPYDLRSDYARAISPEQEFRKTTNKLDQLLSEAQCLQHSAAAIIAHLQDNPEAMAAVGLMLAELSTILTKMGPSVLRTLKVTSPVIFALITSPQFLIATGLTMGATVVMFGGFQIIKKVHTQAESKPEAMKFESAMTFNGLEIESIKSWRRGVAEAEELTVSQATEETYFTPEAVRQWREQSRDRWKDNLTSTETDSVHSEKGARSTRSSQKSSRTHLSSRVAPSVSSSKNSRTSAEVDVDPGSQSLRETKKKNKKKTLSILAPIIELGRQ